jgi:hypothetical protein
MDTSGLSVGVMQAQPKYIVGREVVEWNAGSRRRAADVSLGWQSPSQLAGAAQQAVFREHRTSEDIRDCLEPTLASATPPVPLATTRRGPSGEVVGVMMQQAVTASPVVAWAMDLRGDGGYHEPRCHNVAYEVLQFARRGPGVFSPFVVRVPVTSGPAAACRSPRAQLISTGTGTAAGTKKSSRGVPRSEIVSL